MNKKLSRLVCLLALISLLSFIFSACGGAGNTAPSSTSASNSSSPTDNTPQTAQAEPVTITFPSSAIGTHPLAPFYQKIYDVFNQKYGKEYKLKIDEIPTDGDFEDKLKVEIASSNLPDVFTYNQTATIDLAVKAGLLVDQKQYVTADADWMSCLDEGLLNQVAYDGKWYIVLASKRNIGYFYNKEIFQKAGINAPAQTWDELWADCDKIKQAGFAPFSLVTDGWVENLWLASMIGTSGDTGNKWANPHKWSPSDFATPEFISAAKNLQVMYQKYTTKDAIGGTYDIAENNFLNGKTAMMANGPWMIPDLTNPDKAPKGFDQKVGVSIFPDGGVFEEPQSGYCIGAKDDAHIKGALAFIKTITDNDGQLLSYQLANNIPVSKTLTISDDIKKDKGLLTDLIDLSSKAEYKYYDIPNLFAPSVFAIKTQNESALAQGTITPEKFGQNYADIQSKEQ